MSERDAWPMSFLPRAAKRLFDVTACSIAVVLLLPVYLIIAVAVKVDSPGPVLFRQVRIGLRGRPFVIWKFRTMVPDAERLSANLSPTSDPRVTRIGRFLRMAHLDELPQLVNVLTGRMSVVGPRPETPEFVRLYSPEELRVLNVRPGLLGPSTLATMDEPAILAAADDPVAFYVDHLMHEKVSLDLTYLDRISVLTDVRLCLRQLGRIVLGRS